MQAKAEISFYPLKDDYIPPIRDVIERLKAHAELSVESNTMSTQVSGDYVVLMAALSDEIRLSFERYGKSIFVIKLLPL